MSTENAQLVRCFQAAFGDLAVEQVPNASVETLERWDSLQTLILVAVLEEEFGLRIPAHDFSALRSYASVRDYLHDRRAGSTER
jgi:acyl carrier protein